MGEKVRAAVIGMAMSGVGSAKLLYKQGYEVVINDMKNHIDGLEEALSGIEYIDAMGKSPEEAVCGAKLVVLSPVIPIASEFVEKARANGAEVIGEIELGYRYSDRGTKFVCISGTNGKTTTTALTGEIFKACGRHTFVLGNIGVPITEHAQEPREGDSVVAETAALQLESIVSFRPNAFGMLNITEDHLNRFGFKMENYIAAKCRGFENQTEDDFAVLNYDDPIVRDMARLTRAQVIYFSQKQEMERGMFLRGNTMVWRNGAEETELIDINELRIPGRHNVENAMCAASLGLSMGLEAEGIRKALRSFGGFEHRLEFVREHEGIYYYNDSKGTNPDSTIKAVEAMSRPTVLLLGVGNYDKHVDFKPVFDAFSGRVKAVIASGSNVPAILDAAKRANYTNITVNDGPLRDMVEEARSLCQSGDTVLLSPAAASWGIYDNFEQRGEIFKEIVNSL